MFGVKKTPIRNDLIEAYGSKRSQSIGAYHLLALVQDELADYDEKPIAILAGVSTDKKPALLVLTNERLFLLVGNLFSRDVTSVPLHRISTSSLTSSLLPTFTVYAVDDSLLEIAQVQAKTARDFQTTVRRGTQQQAA